MHHLFGYLFYCMCYAFHTPFCSFTQSQQLLMTCRHVDMTTLLPVHVFHAKQNVWQSSRGSFSPSSSGHKTGESSVLRPSVFDATTATLNAFYEKKSMKRQNYWWRNVIGARSCTRCFKSTRYFSSNIFQTVWQPAKNICITFPLKFVIRRMFIRT